MFDIRVGTAITVATADGSRVGRSAEVYYLDSWAEGHFSRSDKFNWLESGAAAGRLPNAVRIERGPMDDFRPQPFPNVRWPSIPDCFRFSKSGAKSGRDSLFVDTQRAELEHKMRQFLAGTDNGVYNPELIREISYRPFDKRFIYNDPGLLDRPGPELQAAWGRRNVGLYAMPSGTGAGPAVWCHGLLPDYHAFGGPGGYAFPLRDNRPESPGFNIRTELLNGLAVSYGIEAAPEEVFDAVLCLLSAQSYTTRFARDLEDVFPHVPFPTDRSLFDDAVRIGAQIRANQTFAPSQPPPSLADRDFARLSEVPAEGALLVSQSPHDDRLTLCNDGSGRVEGVPRELFSFEVGGYPVLRRWLDGRAGQPVDLALFDAFRDICARIHRHIDLSAQSDTVLADVLTSTLNWDTLGVPAE